MPIKPVNPAATEPAATLHNEARRQIEICNACRYCEGYCAVFPAITRQRSFADGDITQLANLCHNCRGCYYACQYTEPHEFKINIPQVLADVRVQSWEAFIRPRKVSALFQRHGVALAILVIVALSIILFALFQLQPDSGEGFYAHLAHGAMVAIFLPAFVAPLILIGSGLRRYWLHTGGARISMSHVRSALTSTARLKNLSGGQGQGCNFEQGDRFTDLRRWLHQSTLWGFLLCFASTSAGTIMHYAMGMTAPYNFLSLPKLLGVPGGLLLVTGCAGLAWLKTKADSNLGAKNVWGGEMAFVVLLGATGASGLFLYAATGTQAVPALLAIHLATVLAFFLSMPYSKMVHGFFRLAALVRDAQQVESHQQ